ncbi:MAG: phage portal protein [Bacteroidia bacterium]
MKNKQAFLSSGRITGFFTRLQSLANTRQTKGASISYAYVQEGAIYNIGDDPRSYIRDGYRKNPNVYAVIEMIARTAAKAHYKLFDITNPANKVEITQHPLLDLLHRPNPYQGRAEFIENVFGYKLLTGECFIPKIRVQLGMNKGRVIQLITVPPQFVSVSLDESTGLPKSFNYVNGRYSEQILPGDLIFTKYWNPDGTVRGVSPLAAARKVITQSNDGYEASMKLIKNLGPTGILSVSGDNGREYDQTQLDALQKKYEEKYGGLANYGKILMSGGNMSWITTGAKAEDLGLWEGQKMNMRDICNVYGISSQLLNDPDNKTYNNMNEARKALITNCVLPELHLFVDSLNRDLVPEFEKIDGHRYCLEIDKQHFQEIREDEESRVNLLAQAWWMTLNEKRKALGLGEIDVPEGNQMFIPNNLVGVKSE